jgi:ribose 5-phosphate isomerase B
MKIFIAADHAGFHAKEVMRSYLVGLGHEVEDCGAFELDTTDDYPDYILPCARDVARNPESRGIIFGASGQGEAMAANRIPGVRAAVYYAEPLRPQTDHEGNTLDMLSSVRIHNDANILSLGARFLTIKEIQDAVTHFLEIPFLDEDPHRRRIAKF